MQLTDDLTDKQEKALAALLEATSITRAAERVGVARSTLHRWIKNDASFAAAYRDARREALDHALVKLQRNAGRAADVLREVMDNENAPAQSRIAAADKTLQHANTFSDLDEIDELIQELRADHDEK